MFMLCHLVRRKAIISQISPSRAQDNAEDQAKSNFEGSLQKKLGVSAVRVRETRGKCDVGQTARVDFCKRTLTCFLARVRVRVRQYKSRECRFVDLGKKRLKTIFHSIP